MAPAAWVRRLVTLCDHSPATPFQTVKLMLERELGQGIDDVFERFDMEPLGSASIAQVSVELLVCHVSNDALNNGHCLNCSNVHFPQEHVFMPACTDMLGH